MTFLMPDISSAQVQQLSIDVMTDLMAMNAEDRGGGSGTVSGAGSNPTGGGGARSGLAILSNLPDQSKSK